MDVKEAKEILSNNVLDLSGGGMDYMPMKTVDIEYFEIMNKSKANPNDNKTTWYEKAHLIGLIDKNKDKGSSSGELSRDSNFVCCSYIVKVWHDHYYRDFFYEAMEVIEALRVINGYKEEK